MGVSSDATQWDGILLEGQGMGTSTVVNYPLEKLSKVAGRAVICQRQTPCISTIHRPQAPMTETLTEGHIAPDWYSEE